MARGATYLLIQTVVNLVVNLAAFAVIARAVTREDMGVLAILMLVAGGVQILTGLGVGSTVTQFVASLRGQGDCDKMSTAGYSCVVINASMTAVMASVIYLSANSLASMLLGSASRANLFRLLVWEIAATSMTNNSLGSLIQGLKRFKEFSIASMVSFTVRQSTVVVLLILGFGLPGILIGWGIGDSLNAMLLAVFARRALGRFRVGFGFTRLLRFSAPLLLGDAANFTWNYFDRALLIPLVSLAQLGAYNVAVTAYGVLNSVPNAISSTLFPFYSHFYGTGTSGTEDLERAVKTASRYVSFLTIPLSVGLAVTSLPAAVLLAGPKYVDAAYPLAILLIFLAAACLVRALSSIFVVIGKTVTSALITIASVLFPVMIGILIIPHLGILGASIARGASLLVAFAFSVVLLRRIMKVQFDTRVYLAVWAASLIMAGFVLTVEFLVYSEYLLPVYVLTGAVTFLLSLRFMRAVTSEDIELFSSFLPPRSRFVSRWIAKVLAVQP